jgi:hypothetical protein
LENLASQLEKIGKDFILRYTIQINKWQMDERLNSFQKVKVMKEIIDESVATSQCEKGPLNRA